MSTRPYPTQPSELTTDWLTERLRSTGDIGDARVTGFSSTPVGEGIGMLGILVRVALEYDRAGLRWSGVTRRQVRDARRVEPSSGDGVPAVRTRGRLLP